MIKKIPKEKNKAVQICYIQENICEKRTDVFVECPD